MLGLMEMSNSPLVSYTKISPNKTTPRNHKIDTITIHCVVGQLSVERIGAVFTPKANRASSNYGIGPDGRIGMYVEEKDRSWCSSNAANDHRAITIECASDTKHPYTINDKVYSALIDLCVDICKRNNIKQLKWKADPTLIGQVDKQNLTVHRWFANKACPGDYIYNRLGKIAAEVNSRLNPEETKEVCDVKIDILKRGSKGNTVKALQTLLIGNKFSCGRCGADGDFGEGTDSAVRAYQKAKGLTVDGVVGAKTWSKLLGIQ